MTPKCSTSGDCRWPFKIRRTNFTFFRNLGILDAFYFVHFIKQALKKRSKKFINKFIISFSKKILKRPQRRYWSSSPFFTVSSFFFFPSYSVSLFVQTKFNEISIWNWIWKLKSTPTLNLAFIWSRLCRSNSTQIHSSRSFIHLIPQNSTFKSSSDSSSPRNSQWARWDTIVVFMVRRSKEVSFHVISRT